MSNSEITFGLRVVHITTNLEPYEIMLNLVKQNQKLSKAIHIKTQKINSLISVLKKRGDTDYANW